MIPGACLPRPVAPPIWRELRLPLEAAELLAVHPAVWAQAAGLAALNALEVESLVGRDCATGDANPCISGAPSALIAA